MNNGTVTASGVDVPFTSPGSSTTIPNLTMASNSNIVLNTDLVVTHGLNFADLHGTINANGQNITFQDNFYSAAYSGTENSVVLGSGGTLTIEGIANGETAVFQTSFDGTASTFSRVEIINNDTDPTAYSLSICDYVNVEGTCIDGTEVTNNRIDMTWDVAPTPANGNSSLTLFWHEDMEDATLGDNRASAQLNHHNGTNWELLTGDGVVDRTNQIWSSISTTVNSFSPFGVSSLSAPLPVELVSFEAIAENKEIHIEWMTSVELNNDYFKIEKSIDGSSFEVLEIVDGSGNTSSVTEYEVVDSNPARGYQYYRLTQTDFDGTMENLGTRRVEYIGSDPVNFDVFPNPTSNVTSVSNLSPGHYRFEILSIEGKKMNELEMVIDSESQIVNFNLGGLPKGVYLLNVESGSTLYSKKLVKR